MFRSGLQPLEKMCCQVSMLYATWKYPYVDLLCSMSLVSQT